MAVIAIIKNGLIVLLLGVAAVQAQPVLMVDGRATAWPDTLEASTVDGARLVAAWQRAGHYFAAIDDARPDTLWLTRGPAVTLSAVEWSGLTVFDAADVETRLQTKPGDVLHPDVLAGDMDALLQRYERAGFPLARVEVGAVDLVPGEPPGLVLRLAVNEGPAPALAAVELEGATRTRAGFATKTMGLRLGAPLRGYDAAALQRRLESTGLFRRVERPRLMLNGDGDAIVVVAVEEAPPGAFDLVMGYQPPVAGGKGQLVGNGHLLLNNLFGGGRTFGLKLNRLPGQVSRTDVRVADPFVAGRPIRVALHFEGYQRDSTYGRQALSTEAGYTFAEHAEAFVRFSRTFVRPGVASGPNTVPRADAWFGGLGFRYVRLDAPANPRRGVHLVTLFEQGRKGRALGGGAKTVAPQQRFEAEARVFVPLLSRYTLVGGVDARVVRAETYDESDLYRWGGFATLRGYDEERYLGNAVGRALVEARLLLDRTSYLFAFTDVGYVRRPAFADLAADTRVLPGFGVGMQYRTGLGTLVVSYAVNPDDGLTDGRIHAGLSVGL